MRESVVRFENVGMRYGLGAEVLHDIGFELPQGSFHFLTGPSGAGKSSLLRLIYLANRPSRGLIHIFGHDIATAPRDRLPPLRRRIGVVFQEFRLLDSLTVLENVALPLRIAGTDPDDTEKHAREILEWVGLGPFVRAKPSTLSGGQKQRVAIARAVINRPNLLIADEPTGNVDDDIAVRLLYLFEELNRLGTTILIATHSDTLVSRFNHPELHLDGGELRIPPPRQHHPTARPAPPRDIPAREPRAPEVE